MNIVIASDHIGLELKHHIIAYLQNKGHVLTDVGTDTPERIDYPVYAEKAAKAVLGGEGEVGILICGTGIGMAIAANKIKGIRAAVCSEAYSARLTREHNNTNIIAFGSRVVGSAVAEAIADAFLDAEFEGERHQIRIDMITALEANHEAGH